MTKEQRANDTAEHIRVLRAAIKTAEESLQTARGELQCLAALQSTGKRHRITGGIGIPNEGEVPDWSKKGGGKRAIKG